MEQSDYIVYVDESGDHGLQTIDSQYPVFVLAFCIFHKEEYCLHASPSLQAFKFRHFGHDMVVLHERAIRKREGEFGFLVDPFKREGFLNELSLLVEKAPFTLVASVIQKKQLCERYLCPNNPYHIALAFGLERLYSYLTTKGQHKRLTHIVFESRGRREDEELSQEFRRVCQGANYKGAKLPFEITLADKKTNCCGLQLADLVAHPIGRKILSPDTRNRAYEVLAKKFYSRGARPEGLGLKVFP